MMLRIFIDLMVWGLALLGAYVLIVQGVPPMVIALLQGAPVADVLGWLNETAYRGFLVALAGGLVSLFGFFMRDNRPLSLAVLTLPVWSVVVFNLVWALSLVAR